MGFDWEGVIVKVAVDGVCFAIVFLLLEVVGFKSVEQESDCSIFVVCWVVGGVGDYGVCECGLPVYGCTDACGGSVYGNV